MFYLISKYLITAGMVVLISELSKKSDRIGALVASLPLVTILTLIWLCNWVPLKQRSAVICAFWPIRFFVNGSMGVLYLSPHLPVRRKNG